MDLHDLTQHIEVSDPNESDKRLKVYMGPLIIKVRDNEWRYGEIEFVTETKTDDGKSQWEIRGITANCLPTDGNTRSTIENMRFFGSIAEVAE